jgi:hypothetical protein
MAVYTCQQPTKRNWQDRLGGAQLNTKELLRKIRKEQNYEVLYHPGMVIEMPKLVPDSAFVHTMEFMLHNTIHTFTTCS